MKTLLVRLSSFLSFFLLISCGSATTITSDPEAGFALSLYQTFAFMEADPDDDSFSENYKEQMRNVQEEIARQFRLRDLRPGTTEDADLLINVGAVVEEQVQTRKTDIISDPPRYIGQRRYTWQTREVEVGRFQVGTVSVHLVDRERNEMVWQGTAERIISDKPDKLREQIAKGIAELVESIPR